MHGWICKAETVGGCGGGTGAQSEEVEELIGMKEVEQASTNSSPGKDSFREAEKQHGRCMRWPWEHFFYYEGREFIMFVC